MLWGGGGLKRTFGATLHKHYRQNPETHERSEVQLTFEVLYNRLCDLTTCELQAAPKKPDRLIKKQV